MRWNCKSPSRFARSQPFAEAAGPHGAPFVVSPSARAAANQTRHMQLVDIRRQQLKMPSVLPFADRLYRLSQDSLQLPGRHLARIAQIYFMMAASIRQSVVWQEYFVHCSKCRTFFIVRTDVQGLYHFPFVQFLEPKLRKGETRFLCSAFAMARSTNGRSTKPGTRIDQGP